MPLRDLIWCTVSMSPSTSDGSATSLATWSACAGSVRARCSPLPPATAGRSWRHRVQRRASTSTACASPCQAACFRATTCTRAGDRASASTPSADPRTDEVQLGTTPRQIGVLGVPPSSDSQLQPPPHQLLHRARLPRSFPRASPSPTARGTVKDADEIIRKSLDQDR
jgi:hypothetical protein